MALDLSMVLRMEAAAAKSELAAAASGVQKLGAETEKAAAKSRSSAAAAKAEAAARREAAQAARLLEAANLRAAGATGNLVAQFNDIGMMMAAGQNPLQLAIQQGTQISQVIGPMGAAGAARALGAAFVGMLNPISLVTLGVIAGTAALVQWATSSADATAESDALTAATERQKAVFDGLKSVLDDLTVARQMMLSGAESQAEQTAINENVRLTAARNVLENERVELIRQANENMGFLNQAELDALDAKIAANEAAQASNDQLLKNIEAERQRNAETAKAVDLANQVAAATAGIASALQSADGAKLNAAFAGAFPLASQLLGMAQGIIATLGQARIEAAADAQLDQMAFEFSPGGQNQINYGSRAPSGSPAQIALGTRNRPVVTPGTGAGSGGGAGAARDEANAIEELIRSLEAEVEALRTQDPIQAEMLKHREALAGATEAERQKVEELIATREREAALMEGAKARAEFFGDIGNQALEALIFKGESFNDVLKNMVASLIQAAAQAAIFGTGPFGSLFGGKSIMSLIIPGAKAEGGMIHGPGTSTSDSIPTMLSNGEYVVNARATARNRALLEAINSGGRIGGFAEGGMVGGEGRRGSGQARRDLPASIYIDLRGSNGDQAIEQKVRQGAAAVVEMYDRDGLPASIRRVSGDPRRRG